MWNFSSAENAVYRIETDTNTGYTDVYCQMTSLSGCPGKGWTMVMKINGQKVLCVEKVWNGYTLIT